MGFERQQQGSCDATGSTRVSCERRSFLAHGIEMC